MVDVSIIVPIYNRARILLSCLDSISCIKQKKYEVILIDDGSTDDTPLICEEYCKNHTDFYYYRKENGGVSSARNLGIEKSNGKLITFVDSDDVVTPEHLDFLNCKETIDYDIIILGMRNLSSVDHGGGKSSTHAAKYYFTEFDEKHTYRFSVCGKFYRRDICKKYKIRFREDISYGEDSLFNYTFLLHAKTLIQYLNWKTYIQTDLVISGKGQRLTAKILPLDEYYKSFVENYRANRLLDTLADAKNISYGINTLLYAFINYTLINFCRVKNRKNLKYGEHLNFIRNKIKPIFTEIIPYKHLIKNSYYFIIYSLIVSNHCRVALFFCQLYSLYNSFSWYIKRLKIY